MNRLQAHIRSFIYIASAILAAAIYEWIINSFSGQLRLIRLEEWYGFLAALYLFLALLATPLYKVFESLRGKAVFFRARRALGISTFCFALLHSLISFFGLLYGFGGWAFLTVTYQFQLVLAGIALFILFVLAATSFDFAVEGMGVWWKRLHRLVYVAGVLVFIHIVWMGAAFVDPGRFLPSLILILMALLVLVEAARVDAGYAIGKWNYTPRFSWFFILCVILIMLGYTILSGHGGHIH